MLFDQGYERDQTVALTRSAGSAFPPAVSAPRLRPLRLRTQPAWVRSYTTSLVVLEALSAAVVGGAAVLLRTGSLAAPGLMAAAAGLVVGWPALLGVVGAYSERVYGTGSDEFRRVGRAGFLLLAFISFISFAAGIHLSRGFVAVVVPSFTVVSLLGRYAARLRLRRLRAHGKCTKRVVVVGRGNAVVDLVSHLRRAQYAGLDVVAACVTPGDRARVADVVGLPVGGLDDVVALVARLDADTIAVTSASETAAQYLRELSWQLEGSGVELLVAPGLIEVAGPRLHIRPFEGLPLLSVEQPRFEGWQRFVKGVVDRGLGVVALLLLAPVFLAIALAIRLSSSGPVLYRQERVGVNGQTFTMLKFRSMVVDADQRLEGIRAANISDGPLFKMREDPRVTRVGRWLRTLSLDELPQLLNIVGGTMSLVGPRPPLPDEVAQYDSSVRRRLLVKPGLTGLWQISGRSDLPWEEAVRLDLRYVENWSFALDLLIMWKTCRAVLRRSGAY